MTVFGTGIGRSLRRLLTRQLDHSASDSEPLERSAEEFAAMAQDALGDIYDRTQFAPVILRRRAMQEKHVALTERFFEGEISTADYALQSNELVRAFVDDAKKLLGEEIFAVLFPDSTQDDFNLFDPNLLPKSDPPVE